MNKPLVLLVLAAAAMVAACGGSGDSEAQAPTTVVPDSANASIAGMAAWINSESADSSDATEPLDVAAFNPPASDDVEPLGLGM